MAAAYWGAPYYGISQSFEAHAFGLLIDYEYLKLRLHTDAGLNSDNGYPEHVSFPKILADCPQLPVYLASYAMSFGMRIEKDDVTIVRSALHHSCLSPGEQLRMEDALDNHKGWGERWDFNKVPASSDTPGCNVVAATTLDPESKTFFTGLIKRSMFNN